MPMQGAESEEKACHFLKTRGYCIVARNWRTRMGEVDIIARDGGILVFVEVKARTSDGYGGAAGAVDPAKQQRLISAASAFMEKTLCELPTRFDVVTIYPGHVQLYQDAFQVRE